MTKTNISPFRVNTSLAKKGYVAVHTIGKALERVRFGQKIEGLQVQMSEQMLRVRRGHDHGRVVPQSIQKRAGDVVIGVRKPEKDQRAIVGLYAAEHILRKRPGLAELEPAGALEVMGKLASTRP